LLKNLFGTALLRSANRFVRQQQRKKSMKHFVILVNLFFATPQNSAAPVVNTTT